jgi:hypothetical protein
VLAGLSVVIFGFKWDIGYTLGWTIASTGGSIVLPCVARMITTRYG